MLHRFTAFDGQIRKGLIEVYAGSNQCCAQTLYPHEEEGRGIALAEHDLCYFFERIFFDGENICYVWEEDGCWASALQIYALRPDFYYLENLETAPAFRRRGCATRLLAAVVEDLKAGGPFTLCDCVEKENCASLSTHEKCGFHIVSEDGWDYLYCKTDTASYGLAYTYAPTEQ